MFSRLSSSLAALLLFAPPAARAVDLNLIPRAFQSNPILDLTVITEMTDDGRKRPAPTADHPVYFALVMRPMQEAGHSAAGIKAPPVALVETGLAHALQVSGFVGADSLHPPSLVIIADWGIYNLPSAESDADGNIDDAAVDPSGRNLLNRAALIGGPDFARQLHDALTQEYLVKLAMGDGGVYRTMSPVQALRNKNPVLFDRLECELYFIVATAFDAESVARRQPVRLWRTKLTVDSTGVNLTDTLPALLAAGAPYLGRDTPGAIALRPRLQQGNVRLSPLEVLGEADQAGAKPEGK